MLKNSLFYLFASLLFFGSCILLWKPLPVAFDSATRILALALGILLFFPGLALVIWGWFALGKMYFVSTSLGAQLFSDHRLITSGPFTLVRHPMYLGLMLLGFGGVLIYRTWAFVFIALSFLALVFRARREEQALSGEFGQKWEEYSRIVPFIIPHHVPVSSIKGISRSHPVSSPGKSALLEVCVLFLPAIPAYLWLWPSVSGAQALIAQIIAYLYVLIGTLWIGLRRWTWKELGVNRNGLGISLACGLCLLVGRLLVILSINWGSGRPQYSPADLAGQALFYFGLVGVVEELLYRGLIYQALDQWLGTRWAIWGSSLGFVLWHIFGQGPVIGAAALLIGLIFALIRWRTASILGLILIHGFWDLESVLLVASSNAEILSRGQPDIPSPGWMLVGLALMLVPPIYLWLLYPILRPNRFGLKVVANLFTR